MHLCLKQGVYFKIQSLICLIYTELVPTFNYCQCGGRERQSKTEKDRKTDRQKDRKKEKKNIFWTRSSFSLKATGFLWIFSPTSKCLQQSEIFPFFGSTQPRHVLHFFRSLAWVNKMHAVAGASASLSEISHSPENIMKTLHYSEVADFTVILLWSLEAWWAIWKKIIISTTI